MDRNAVESPTVSYEEIIAGMANQIGQLHADLIANRLMIQKLQNLLQKIGNTIPDKIDSDSF